MTYHSNNEKQKYIDNQMHCSMLDQNWKKKMFSHKKKSHIARRNSHILIQYVFFPLTYHHFCGILFWVFFFFVCYLNYLQHTPKNNTVQFSFTINKLRLTNETSVAQSQQRRKQKREKKKTKIWFVSIRSFFILSPKNPVCVPI